MKRSLLLIITLLFASRSFASDSSQVTPQVAERYAIYAMMSSNSYHKDDRPRFPLEEIGWKQIARDGKETTEPSYSFWLTGLSFDIYKKNSVNEYVFVYRGTDSKIDYLTASIPITFFMSPQYKSANKKFRQFIASIPKDSKVTVTGHSLGGGLALSASVRYGQDAVVFDSSPRIFDGLGDEHLPAKRTAIYQTGEVLEKFRKMSTKYPDVVGPENTYISNFDFGDVSPHSSYALATNLLAFGATFSPELQKIKNLMAE
jgi:putative lipase involved disintegration of autophagic bodies